MIGEFKSYSRVKSTSESIGKLVTQVTLVTSQVTLITRVYKHMHEDFR